MHRTVVISHMDNGGQLTEELKSTQREGIVCFFHYLWETSTLFQSQSKQCVVVVTTCVSCVDVCEFTRVCVCVCVCLCVLHVSGFTCTSVRVCVCGGGVHKTHAKPQQRTVLTFVDVQHEAMEVDPLLTTVFHVSVKHVHQHGLPCAWNQRHIVWIPTLSNTSASNPWSPAPLSVNYWSTEWWSGSCPPYNS